MGEQFGKALGVSALVPVFSRETPDGLEVWWQHPEWIHESVSNAVTMPAIHAATVDIPKQSQR